MATRVSFLLRHLGPALAGAALLLALEKTGVDSAVSRWFFDPEARAFPLRYNQWLELLGHEWAKALIVLVTVCTIGSYLMSFVVPALEPRRRLLLFLSAALTAAPLAVVLLKAASVRHCPWSLQEFGGSAPHLTLFDAVVPGWSPGHCFPSGHASAGYSLLAFYFAGRTLGSRTLARVGLWGGLVVGTAFGVVRVAQGAHFLSHNLWSALVCWLVILAFYLVLLGRAEAGYAGQGEVPGPAGCTRASLQARSRL